VSYYRSVDDEISHCGSKIPDSDYDNVVNMHVSPIQFDMTFKDDENSQFIFNAGYKVNDLKWYNQLTQEQVDALFLSVLFPYVREKVNSLTNDYRGSINIPTIDLRQVDLKEGITFTKEQ